MRFSRYRAAYSSSREDRHLDRRCPCSAVQGLCVIEGLPNNRPGFGRVLNHDGSSFPMAGATATASGIDRALFAAKSHFFYFGHVTFHSWVVANTSMLPFVVTVPPPLAGLVTKSWARGAAVHV